MFHSASEHLTYDYADKTVGISSVLDDKSRRCSNYLQLLSAAVAGEIGSTRHGLTTHSQRDSFLFLARCVMEVLRKHPLDRVSPNSGVAKEVHIPIVFQSQLFRSVPERVETTVCFP